MPQRGLIKMPEKSRKPRPVRAARACQIRSFSVGFCRRRGPSKAPDTKRGRDHGAAPARRVYPARGPFVLPLPVPACGRSQPSVEIGTLTNKTTTTTPAPSRGHSVVALHPAQAGGQCPVEAPGTPSPNTTVPDPNAARNELGRSILDAAICHPRLSAADELDSWLGMIEGVAGFLGCSAAALRDDSMNTAPLPEHVAAVGALIERSAKIARGLADAVAAGQR